MANAVEALEPLEDWTAGPDEEDGKEFKRFKQRAKIHDQAQTKMLKCPFDSYTVNGFDDSDDRVGLSGSRGSLDKIELGLLVVDNRGSLDDNFFLRLVELFELKQVLQRLESQVFTSLYWHFFNLLQEKLPLFRFSWLCPD